MNKTEKEFQAGYDLGLDLIDKLGVKTKENPTSNHMAGIVSSILNFSYVFAPSEKHADNLIQFCIEKAKCLSYFHITQILWSFRRDSREYKENKGKQHDC